MRQGALSGSGPASFATAAALARPAAPAGELLALAHDPSGDFLDLALELAA
jgi:hypothetical protein